MSEWLLRRFIVAIPVDKVAVAKRLAAALDPDREGDRTFEAVRASPTGQEPATHLIACTQLQRETARELGARNKARLKELVRQRGRREPTDEDIDAALPALVVRPVADEETPQDAIAALGLQIIAPLSPE